ncbi:MAG TPA: hypothetical protein V6C58_22410 [Allocoleopsis sp.]
MIITLNGTCGQRNYQLSIINYQLYLVANFYQEFGQKYKDIDQEK